MALTQQTILDAEEDLRDLAAIVNGPADQDVMTRTGGPVPTLKKSLLPLTSANDAVTAAQGYAEDAATSAADAATAGDAAGRAAAEAVVADKVDSAALAADTGGDLVGVKASGAGAVGRTAQAKLRDIVSIGDFGAVGDDAADDTAAVTALDALSGRKLLTRGVFHTTLAASALNGPFYGEGQIRDAAGHKRAPWFTAIKVTPASGSRDDISTFFDGDISHVLLPIEHRIAAGVLTIPATGYAFYPEAAAVMEISRNEGGGNTSLTSNGGRTSANLRFAKIEQYGGGDHFWQTVSGFLAGVGPVGATSWLAMPALGKLNGTLTLGMHAGYLNSYEDDLNLGSYDGAAYGPIININRSVGDTVNGKGAPTGGFRAQSVGSYAVDAVLSASGLFKVMLDATPANFGTNKALLVGKAGDRLYLNGSSTDGMKATSYGTDFIERSTSGFLNFVYNNASIFQANDSRVTFLKPTRLVPITASQLPGASGNAGMEAYITDCNSSTRGAAAAGGGSTFAKVYSNGTSWIIA